VKIDRSFIGGAPKRIEVARQAEGFARPPIVVTLEALDELALRRIRSSRATP